MSFPTSLRHRVSTERLCRIGIFRKSLSAGQSVAWILPDASAAILQNDQPSDGQSDTGSLTRYSGKARFIHDLLRHVIFPEADLAILDKTARRKIQWRQRGMCCAALLLLSVFGVLWATGFSANHDRLERLRVLGEQWAQQRSSLSAEDDLLTVLDSLNTLYLAAQVFPDGDEVLLYERSGLYRGEPANDVLMRTYHAELQRQLLPRVAHMIEARIMANPGIASSCWIACVPT